MYDYIALDSQLGKHINTTIFSYSWHIKASYLASSELIWLKLVLLYTNPSATYSLILSWTNNRDDDTTKDTIL